MTFPQLPGEATGVGGVCHPDYPAGNVRRYANGALVHDAANITGTFTLGSATVTGVSTADMALVIVGQSVADVTDFTNFGTPAILPTVVSKAANSFNMSAAATFTRAGSAIAIGTEWQSVAAFFNAVRANSLHPGIEIDFGVGEIFGGWNMAADWSGLPGAPGKINWGRTNFWGVVHWLEGVSYQDCAGQVGSYDRIGIAGGYRVTAALVAGSRVINQVSADAAGDFRTAPVGAIIRSASIRTGQGEVTAKPLGPSGKQLMLDEPAVEGGNIDVYVCSNRLSFDTLIGLQNNKRNPYNPGRGNRGMHLVQPYNFKARRLWQFDCDQTIRTYTVRGVASPQAVPAAAMQLDLGKSRNFQVDEMWVRDSFTHGVMLTEGMDVNIGTIMVDGSVKGGIQFPKAGDGGLASDMVPGVANTYAQGCEGKGLWLNNVSGYIGQYIVKQKNDPPSGAERARVMIEDSGSAAINERFKPLVIGRGYAEVGSKTTGMGVGVFFGDPDGTTGQMNVRHGPLTVEMHDGYGLDVSTTVVGMVNFFGTTAPGGAPVRSRIHCPDISVINPQGFIPVYARCVNFEKKTLVIGVDVFELDIAGPLVDIAGNSTTDLRLILRTSVIYGGSSYVTKAAITIDYCDQVTIDQTRLESLFACANAALRITNSQKVVVRNSAFERFRGNSVGGGCIQLANNSDVILDGVTVSNPGGNISGMFGFHLDSGSHGKLLFRRCDSIDFETGIKKHASATITDPILFENCHAWVTSGPTIIPTDIPVASRLRVG